MLKKNPKLEARRRRMKTIIIEIPVKLKREGDNWICYNIRYNISGYGRTLKMAHEMFKVCADEALKFKAPNKRHEKLEKVLKEICDDYFTFEIKHKGKMYGYIQSKLIDKAEKIIKS